MNFFELITYHARYYEYIIYPQNLIKDIFFFLSVFIQQRLSYVSIIFQEKFPNIYRFFLIVYMPLWLMFMVTYGVTCICSYIWKKINFLYALYCPFRYKNDKILNKIFMTEIKLKQEDVEHNNKMLKDVVQDRIVDYMKIVDGDFKDLFEDILYGGSFYKDLKVSQPDEYDLCLMIDLSRSIDSGFIKIEPDEHAASYVKIKICQKEFNENKSFWYNILDKNNYLNQDKFRDWIYCILKKALKALSNGPRPEGYTVKHLKNTYCINVRPKGPALTLTIIRKNNWKKIEVDLVPCLVFKNQYLPGFRSRKAKRWISVAKPLKNYQIDNRELLWRAGFQEDEKAILAKPIKPVIKLVKKLRDVQGWTHLKSYFIETLFMHELDDPVFRLFYSRCSKKMLFMYMLQQLQSKLEKGELLYYWHKGFNLIDKNNSLSLLETSKELKEIIDRIEENGFEDFEDKHFFKMFHPNAKTKPEPSMLYPLILAFCGMVLHQLYKNSVLDPYIDSTSTFFQYLFALTPDSTIIHQRS